MGQLSIQIGPLNRSINAPDNKMTTILNKVIKITNGPVDGTPAQKADWVLGVIKHFLVDVADGQDKYEAIAQAESTRVPLDLNE